jgi:hypothetical protein
VSIGEDLHDGMSHAGEHVSKAGGKAKEFLTHQIGPLPVWAWLGAVAGGLVIYKWRSGKAAAGPAAAATNGPGAATDTTSAADTGLGLGGNTTTQPGAGNLYDPYDNGSGLGTLPPDAGAGTETPVNVTVLPAPVQVIDNGGPTAHHPAPAHHAAHHPEPHPVAGAHHPHPAQGAQSHHVPAPHQPHPAAHAAHAATAAPAHHDPAHAPAQAHPATSGHESAHHKKK